ncbi:MAG: diaminopimelate decarboxylase [Bacteroidales bacterium]|nr:diaminopimelate decarboxylase [Bacteroidales bacterium]MBQ9597916.1 diaminopimelate decarboxylase [Bacteroidales bacterium]
MMEKSLIERLTGEYGCPLYVFDKAGLVSDFNQLQKAFRSYYPKYRIAYSYKTNYAPRICSIVRELGGLAEVVSDMELTIARKVGYPDGEILYNGPTKGPLMEDFLLKGGIVNIDNPAEALRVVDCANAHPESVLQVGIRVNMDVGQPFVSRFGMEAYTEEFDTVVKCLRETPNIRLIGLHCHIGRSRGVEAWKARAEYMLGVADRYFECPPAFIDLGSGMFGNMEESLARQFGDDIPTFEDYAQVVAGEFARHYVHLPETEKPWLLTEPGTTLISAHISVIARVTGIKRLRGKDFANLDCCLYNVGEMCRIKNMPLQVVPGGGERRHYESIALSGYTCLEYDVIHPSYSGELGVGDYVVVGNCGGYSNVSKPPFIAPNCAMVEWDGSRSTLFKRAETPDDVLSTYIF